MHFFHQEDMEKIKKKSCDLAWASMNLRSDSARLRIESQELRGWSREVVRRGKERRRLDAESDWHPGSEFHAEFAEFT